MLSRIRRLSIGYAKRVDPFDGFLGLTVFHDQKRQKSHQQTSRMVRLYNETPTFTAVPSAMMVGTEPSTADLYLNPLQNAVVGVVEIQPEVTITADSFTAFDRSLAIQKPGDVSENGFGCR